MRNGKPTSLLSAYRTRTVSAELFVSPEEKEEDEEEKDLIRAMISYDTSSVFGIIFQLKGSVLLKVWPEMLLNGAIGLAAALLRHEAGDAYPIRSVTAWQVLGTTLGFLLVFRSNLSYGRYWEGRGHLGALVRAARELTRQMCAYTKDDRTGEMAAMRERMRRYTVLVFRVIVMAVRRDQDLDSLVKAKWLTVSERTKMESTGNPKARPSIVATWMSQCLYDMFQKGKINAAVLKKMDSNVSAFIEGWMGMNKIVSTPMVFPYTQMLSIFMVLFIFSIPFPLADAFNQDRAMTISNVTATRSVGHPMPLGLSAAGVDCYAPSVSRLDCYNPGMIITPLVSMLCAYAFFGINAIGMEIENPFGVDANDLDAESMIQRAEEDTLAIMQQRDAPKQGGEFEGMGQQRQQQGQAYPPGMLGGSGGMYGGP